MTSQLQEVLIFTPTPNEYKSVKNHVENANFKNFSARVVESGLGKINAVFKMTSEVLPRLSRGNRPLCLIGAGTSGSLNKSLASGEVIASSSVVISDWRMEDGDSRHFCAYGELTYRPVDSELADEMSITCDDPLVEKLMGLLPDNGFKQGRLLTADTFVAGTDHKLSLGNSFKALACDMESGAYSYTARNLLGDIPCFNLRVVADTLDDAFADYLEKEADVTDILGKKTVKALALLDNII